MRLDQSLLVKREPRVELDQPEPRVELDKPVLLARPQHMDKLDLLVRPVLLGLPVRLDRLDRLVPLDKLEKSAQLARRVTEQSALLEQLDQLVRLDQRVL